jgi:hypothetical protein
VKGEGLNIIQAVLIGEESMDQHRAKVKWNSGCSKADEMDWEAGAEWRPEKAWWATP